jgi:3-phenylpropionate/trans-cinnamate dioxygenase ferredoxin reductase component
MTEYPRYVHFNYVIVGAGMTGDAAAHGIREVDPEGSICLVSAEHHTPYDRPPLSKGLWKDKPLESIWRKNGGQGVDFRLGRHVRDLDPAAKRITDHEEAEFTFDKLLLATGGTPRRLEPDEEGIIYFRTVDDYLTLRRLAEERQHFLVVGGGFIGSEIAAALAMNGKRVTMVFPDEAIGARVYPHELSLFLNDFYRQKGIEVLSGERVSSVARTGDTFMLSTQSGRAVPADGVVAGLGITPNVELARGADLAVDNGILVDQFLRTSHPDIYAAGDVANFYNPALDRRLRVEHEDNANTMGKMAGRAMAGSAEPYHHLPFFYSDLFELGYEAVGDLDARLETVADWKEPFREGVIYYLREGRVRGVLLWNVWGQVGAARRLIADPGPFRPEDLKGRLPASS